MSVLLEALKKAALEKKGKSPSDATGEATQAPPLLTPLDQSPLDDSVSAESQPDESTVNDVPVVAEPEPLVESLQEEVEEEAVPVLIDEVDEAGEAEDAHDLFEEFHDTDDDNEELDLDDLLAEAAEDEESEAGFDNLIDEDLLPDEQEREQLRQEAEAEAEAQREQERLDALRAQQEKQEADRLEAERLEQERVAREASELSQEIERREAEEARRREEEAALAAQQAEQEEAEERRAQEDAERRRAENETALTELVHNGHAINRQQKRRSRFLYAMLVMTAIGGIVSYYFYLLGSNTLSLLPRDQAVTVAPAPIEDVIEETATAVAPDTETSTSSESPLPVATREPEMLAVVPVEENPTSTAPAADGLTTTDNAIASVDWSADEIHPPPSSDSSSASAALVFSPPITIRGEDAPPVDRVAAPVAAPLVEDVTETTVALNDIEAIIEPVAAPAPADVAVPVEASRSTLTNESVAAQAADTDPQRVQIYHEAVPSDLSNLVNDAYDAFRRNELAKAGSLYASALSIDPNSRDALLGAAAVHAAEGRYQQAFALYQRRLNLDPTDSYAQAGILSLSSQAVLDPNEIDALLEVSPEAAHLHFLKGAAHAAENDWASAQAAFFEAHHWDQTNADYAFNLAVSLDHLGQLDSAMRFYKQAVNLAESQATGFSVSDVKKRLDQIYIDAAINQREGGQ